MDTRSFAKNKSEFKNFKMIKINIFPLYIPFHFLLRGMCMHPMVLLAAGTLRAAVHGHGCTLFFEQDPLWTRNVHNKSTKNQKLFQKCFSFQKNESKKYSPFFPPSIFFLLPTVFTVFDSR